MNIKQLFALHNRRQEANGLEAVPVPKALGRKPVPKKTVIHTASIKPRLAPTAVTKPVSKSVAALAFDQALAKQASANKAVASAIVEKAKTKAIETKPAPVAQAAQPLSLAKKAKVLGIY